jgi:hypothetical protein
MVAEQLPDNSELRVDVLLEGIESYRGIDVQRGLRLTFFHSTIDRRFRARITPPRARPATLQPCGSYHKSSPVFGHRFARKADDSLVVTQRQCIVITRIGSMNIAIYLRVSTDRQTTQSQAVELWEYCARRGWNDVREFSDTASGAKFSREGLDALMREVRKGRIDIVVAYKLDRLGRSLARQPP